MYKDKGMRGEFKMKIKGFDKNLCCRGMQFEIGKEYKIELNGRKIELCTDTVFHYCESLINVHKFYNAASDNRFCEIEVLGDEITDGLKFGSNHIKITREITDGELDVLKGLTNGNTGLFNSGDYNSGDYNSGDRNSGDDNSGDDNSGNRNSGDYNSGNRNSGDYNSGNRNSGLFNSCSYSAGVFCDKEDNIKIFNMDSGMTAREFYASEFYRALYASRFVLSETLKNGEIKTYSHEEACANWWSSMAAENKKIIMRMPNFDKTVFKNITGIEIEVV